MFASANHGRGRRPCYSVKGAANGPCVSQVIAAAKTDDPAQIQAGLKPHRSAGRQSRRCRGSLCPLNAGFSEELLQQITLAVVRLDLHPHRPRQIAEYDIPVAMAPRSAHSALSYIASSRAGERPSPCAGDERGGTDGLWIGPQGSSLRQLASV
jgi:hypothetical protein